jgi:hypothetical protein
MTQVLENLERGVSMGKKNHPGPESPGSMIELFLLVKQFMPPRKVKDPCKAGFLSAGGRIKVRTYLQKNNRSKNHVNYTQIRDL